MRIRGFSVSLISLIVASMALGQDVEPEPTPELPGTYRLGPSAERAREAINAAIDEGVAAMGPLRRAVGRRRLRAKNRVVSELEIALVGERVRVRYDDERYEVRLGGYEPVTLPDGERVQLRARLRGATLTLDWKTDDGDRRDTFTRLANGTLVFGVTITSDQLPNPVRYRIVYRPR
ncbi:MAG: hypothetical protein KF901_25095 [Myxococcales bacterium]|nr:hypothetical protein [Myxococcales bacterium]